MKLNQFIDHLKHNSIKITIINNDTDVKYFDGKLSTYRKQKIKDIINNYYIVKILPLFDCLMIFIKDYNED